MRPVILMRSRVAFVMRPSAISQWAGIPAATTLPVRVLQASPTALKSATTTVAAADRVLLSPTSRTANAFSSRQVRRLNPVTPPTRRNNPVGAAHEGESGYKISWTCDASLPGRTPALGFISSSRRLPVRL